MSNNVVLIETSGTEGWPICLTETAEKRKREKNVKKGIRLFRQMDQMPAKKYRKSQRIEDWVITVSLVALYLVLGFCHLCVWSVSCGWLTSFTLNSLLSRAWQLAHTCKVCVCLSDSERGSCVIPASVFGTHGSSVPGQKRRTVGQLKEKPVSSVSLSSFSFFSSPRQSGLDVPLVLPWRTERWWCARGQT